MTDLILALVTWRLSSLFVHEDAPFSLLSAFRHRIGIKYDENSKRVATNELAKLFSCVWCLSVWVGWLVAFLYYRSAEFVVYGLAYSTVAIVIEKAVRRG